MRTMCKSAGILALVLVAAAPTMARADYIQAQPVYAHNNTDHKIQVAAYYVPAGSQDFVSGGWWTIYPGQCRLILCDREVEFR